MRGPITERLFIAVGLPSDVGAALEETARRLAPYWPSGVVRWTTAGNQHLTLRFLGDTRPEQVAKLKVVMDEVVAGCANLIKINLSKSSGLKYEQKTLFLDL